MPHAPAAAGITPHRSAVPHRGAAAACAVEAREPHGGLPCDDECQYCWGPETD